MTTTELALAVWHKCAKNNVAEAAALIEAHEAEILREAADRAIRWAMIPEYFKSEEEICEHLRAAIEAKP